MVPLVCIRTQQCKSGVSDYFAVWSRILCTVCAETEVRWNRYNPEHHLEAAIAATGHKLEDVKHIILGHLHMDHAGGLELFKVWKTPRY